MREIAALYLNMNINDISLCWVLRALTFWFCLILVWLYYINAMLHLLANELSATWFGLYVCRTPNNDFTTWKHREWFVRLAHASKTASYHNHKSGYFSFQRLSARLRSKDNKCKCSYNINISQQCKEGVCVIIYPVLHSWKSTKKNIVITYLLFSQKYLNFITGVNHNAVIQYYTS